MVACYVDLGSPDGTLIGAGVRLLAHFVNPHAMSVATNTKTITIIVSRPEEMWPFMFSGTASAGGSVLVACRRR